MTYTAGKTNLTQEQIMFIQTADAAVLAAAARGEIDLNLIAREELAARGLDRHGSWVGFPAAARVHGITK